MYRKTVRDIRTVCVSATDGTVYTEGAFWVGEHVILSTGSRILVHQEMCLHCEVKECRQGT